MYELYPYFTNDGSVGLFSPEADDIYHSTYGALSEAYEKFVLPANLDVFFKTNNKIKVLDICYGIGYNSKSFLNFLFEKKYLKILKNKKNKNFFAKILSPHIDTIYINNNQSICNEQIDTNNIICNNIHDANKNNINGYNVKVYSNNTEQDSSHENATSKENFIEKNNLPVSSETLPKIYIKALDIDENLFYLSPFFKQGKLSDKKYNKLNFHYNKISKLLNNKFEAKFNLNQVINQIIFYEIINKLPEILQNKDIISILTKKEYRPFFNKELTTLFVLLRKSRYKSTPLRVIYGFLHNIYYKYLSKRYKNDTKPLILNDFKFDPIVGDARQSLIEDKNRYNFIFLDAFTPAKCPALWSLEFFKLLFEHLEDDGMILTYSNSAAIRNAMINAGFYVGKIYSEEYKKFTGTIAVKNKTLIKHELSEYDLGLINSKAGIFYRDENLNALNEQIIRARELEVENSDKISSSRFIKDFRRKNEI